MKKKLKRAYSYLWDKIEEVFTGETREQHDARYRMDRAVSEAADLFVERSQALKRIRELEAVLTSLALWANIPKDVTEPLRQGIAIRSKIGGQLARQMNFLSMHRQFTKIVSQGSSKHRQDALELMARDADEFKEG